MGIGDIRSFLRTLVPQFVRERWAVKVGIAGLVVIVVLGSVGGLVFAQTGTQLTEDAQFQMETGATSQSTVMSDWVSELKQQAHTLGYAQAVQTDDPQQVSAFLNRVSAEDRLPREVTAIHYLDTSTSTVRASTVESVSGMETGEVGFPWSADSLNLSEDGASVSDPYSSPSTEAATIAVVASTHGQDNRAIVLEVNLTKRAEGMARPVQDSFTKVVNSDGTTVLSHRTDQILTQNMGEQDVESVDSMAVKKGLEGMTGYMEMEMMDNEMVMGFAPVEGTDWVLMTHSPASTMFALKSDILENFLLLIGISILGFGMVGLVVGRNTTRSLADLTAKAEALESGDLDVEVQSHRVDEIGQLYATFRNMRDSIRSSLEEQIEEAEQASKEAEQARKQAEQQHEQSEALVDHLESKADAYSATMAQAAEGDLHVRLTAESESQAMTQIAEGFNEMMDDIESTMQDIQAFANEVVTATEQANAGSQEAKQASEEVSSSIQEISSGTDEQREMLEEVAGEMSDLSATVEEVASSAETVAETSRKTADISEAGETTAQEAIENSRAVQTAIHSTVDNVQRLDDQMTEIGEIIDLISDIAEQTNMLALNANIEAARAGGGESGDSGEGFAVVADEVKQLAEETQASATEIEQLVTEVQEQTTTTVEEVQTAEQHMQEGVEAVEDVVDAFTQVAENTERTDSGIQEISDAADEQAHSAEQAVSMVEEVADISQTTANEAESVSAAAEQQAASMSQVSSNVGSLTAQAERLQSLLTKFEVGQAQAEMTDTTPRGAVRNDGGSPQS